MLHLHNICLAPGAEAFDHEFASGTLNVVLGRNRSGKTNLCRLIAGLDCSATGDVSIDGEKALFELLESGNFLIYCSDGVETGQWFATEEGIVINTNDGDSAKAFVNGDSLFVTSDDETFTLKRVK